MANNVEASDITTEEILMVQLATLEHYLVAIDHVQTLLFSYLLAQPAKVRTASAHPQTMLQNDVMDFVS